MSEPLYLASLLSLRHTSRKGQLDIVASYHYKSMLVIEVSYSDGQTWITMQPNTKL